MVPLELEVPSAIVGFALGGFCLLGQRILTSALLASRRLSSTKSAVCRKEDLLVAVIEEDLSRFSPKPSAEPDCEPDCEVVITKPAARQDVAAEGGPKASPLTLRWPWIGLQIIVAFVVTTVLLLRHQPWRERGVGMAAERTPAIEKVEGDEVLSSGMLTLTLTRQQLTVHQDEGTYYKTAYWGTVLVGEPPVPFTVVFDTGSGHLILPSTYCHSQTCRAHRRYRRSHSATAKDIDYDGVGVHPGELRDHITVSFGTGEVTGVFVEDIVCMGDSRSPGERAFNDTVAAAVSSLGAVTVQRNGDLPRGCRGLRMIAATEMSEDPFRDFEFDGVLGLGLSGLSQSPMFNMMHVLSSTSRKVEGRNPHVFSVFLADHEQEESQITFGGYKNERAEETLAWHQVSEPTLGQWMVRIKSIRVDGEEPLAYCRDGDCRAIVDTGTSLIAVPTTVFPELFELLLHPADTAGECTGPGPKLHIELESITVTLEPRDYSVFESAERSRVRALITQNEDDAEEDSCKAMLMAMDLPKPLGPKLFVLGEPVLRRYYTVYDSGPNPRVGLARARHESAGT